MSLSEKQIQLIDEQIQRHKEAGDTQKDVAEFVSQMIDESGASDDFVVYVMQQATIHLEEGDFSDLSEASLLEKAFAEEFNINEKQVKTVSVSNMRKGGQLITRKLDRKTRERRATQTTGLSKSKRVRTAKKAARTRRREKNSAVMRKAKKKRKLSMKKRKQMGL